MHLLADHRKGELLARFPKGLSVDIAPEATE